jgi:hypothetical protein
MNLLYIFHPRSPCFSHDLFVSLYLILSPCASNGFSCISLKSDIFRGSLCISHGCPCTRISYRSLCVFLESHITDLLVSSLNLSFVKQKIGLITKHFSEQNSLIEYKISPRSFPLYLYFLGSLPNVPVSLPDLIVSLMNLLVFTLNLFVSPGSPPDLPLSPIHYLAISL